MTELDEVIDQLEEDASKLIQELPHKCSGFQMFVMDYGWEVLVRQIEKE